MNQMVSNWGNFPVVRASVKSFRSETELKKIITSGNSYIARGNGRCYGDSSLHGDIISTRQFNNVLFFDAKQGILECQAGLMLDNILQLIVPKGWFLPVTPGTKFITVGGAVASDIHGKNHHVDGSFKNHLLELRVLTESGKITSCSRETEPDLFWTTCGGMGLTGIILSAKFRLKKIRSAEIDQVAFKARNLDEIFELFEKYKHVTYSVAWIDCFQTGSSLGRSVLMVGEHAEHAKPISYSQKSQRKWLTIPFYLPDWVLSAFTIRIFNFVYYHKQLAREKKSRVSFESFFYPLDFINHWNRMYGTQGFVQYQFALPYERSKEGLKRILEKIGTEKRGSFLAVLKLFGEGDNTLSFPIRGYTLALDFPVRKGLWAFLDSLDEIVMEHGGRIYLTKDARMSASVFNKGYPQVDWFKKSLAKIAPTLKWRSRQSDRLNISSK